jgi:hypothetical protein
MHCVFHASMSDVGAHPVKRGLTGTLGCRSVSLGSQASAAKSNGKRDHQRVKVSETKIFTLWKKNLQSVKGGRKTVVTIPRGREEYTKKPKKVHCQKLLLAGLQNNHPTYYRRASIHFYHVAHTSK